MVQNKNVIIESGNGVGWIKLNRPKALNALSWDMVHAIYNQLEEWKEDSDIALVCLTSTHEDAFCAGGDVKAVYNHAEEGDIQYAADYLSMEYAMDYNVHTYPKPILAYMNGLVMGGGVGLSSGSDFRLVTEKTKWSMPELQIGFFPDVAASYFLNQFPGYTGRYLALTANLIDGSDAMYIGAADYYLQSSQWEALQEEIKIKNWKLETCENELKTLLNNYCNTDIDGSELSKLQEQINNHFSFETVEEIVDSLEADAKHSDLWAQKTLDRLASFPPTSLKATLELLIRGKKKSLLDCFKMDLDLSMNIIETHNMREGIRSVLVDKDKRFNWNPVQLDEVSNADVEGYFEHDWKDGIHPIDQILNK